jgi:hypothetical protein
LLNLNAKRMSTAHDGGMFLHFNRRLSYEASAEGALVKAEVCGKALEPEAWYRLVADAYLVTNYIPSFPQHGHAVTAFQLWSFVGAPEGLPKFMKLLITH